MHGMAKRPMLLAALVGLAALGLSTEPAVTSDQCQKGGEANLPFPSTSAKVRPIDSMHVMRSATVHPFWMALPTELATPGLCVFIVVRARCGCVRVCAAAQPDNHTKTHVP